MSLFGGTLFREVKMVNTINDISILYNRAKDAQNEEVWKDLMIDTSKKAGRWLDKMIMEQTPEALTAIDSFITLASSWVITVHLGTQLRSILYHEPKYCKSDPNKYLEHFQPYREKHLDNYRKGMVIPPKEHMFLAKDL